MVLKFPVGVHNIGFRILPVVSISQTLTTLNVCTSGVVIGQSSGHPRKKELTIELELTGQTVNRRKSSVPFVIAIHSQCYETAPDSISLINLAQLIPLQVARLGRTMRPCCGLLKSCVNGIRSVNFD